MCLISNARHMRPNCEHRSSPSFPNIVNPSVYSASGMPYLRNERSSMAKCSRIVSLTLMRYATTCRVASSSESMMLCISDGPPQMCRGVESCWHSSP